MNIENKIPDSEFKKELSEFGLIKKKKLKILILKYYIKIIKNMKKKLKKIIIKMLLLVKLI